MRRRVLPFLAVFCLLLLPASALAVGTLDQSYEENTGLVNATADELHASQVFTAGASGLLDTVELHGSDWPCPGRHHTVQIRATTPEGAPVGVPSDSSGVLAKQVGVECGIGFYDVTFTSPATVVAGQKYAIVFGNYGIEHHYNSPGGYAGGTTCGFSVVEPFVWNCLEVDFLFRTYVTAPEPQPDGRIRRGSGLLVGNDIYNSSGLNQTRSGAYVAGARPLFRISIQNDGNVADKFLVAASGATVTGYKIRYFRGTTEITNAVVAGSYQTPVLGPGRSITIEAWVKVRSTAAVGSKVSRLVTITSLEEPTEVDAVKFAVERR